MSNQLNWTEQFKISEATLTLWKANQTKSQAASGVTDASPLFWGLANGQLPELEYYNWAQEKFELPYVRSDFFAIPVDPIFWNAVKDLHSWNASLYPLALWDGVLLIGCVEPPKGFAYPRPFRFVLANARQLQMHWANLNPQLQAAKAVRQVSKLTDPDPLPTPEVRLDVPDGFHLSPPSGSGGTQTGIVDMHTFPDGVNPGSFDLADVDVNRAEGIISVEMQEVDLSIPDGFESAHGDLGGDVDHSEQAAYAEQQASYEAAQLEPSDDHQNEEVNFQNDDSEDVAPAEAAYEPQVIDEPNYEPAQQASYAADPHELTASAVTASAVTASAVIEPTMTFTGTNSPDINWVIPVDPISLDRTRSLDELALHTLSAVSRQFNGALIFLRSTQGYKPWKFTQPFRTPRKEFGALDLAAPSLFRIVDRTHLPYHGYIEPAPENDRFFKAFLGGMAPAHITVMPIMNQKICIGMIIGINDVVTPYKHILPIMDGLASQFAINYKRLDSTMSAASA